MNLYKNKKTYYLAVCCELRETLKNNHLLKNSLKIGEFLSDTDYVLVDVFEINNNVELHNGNNSVIFEVYKVNLLTLLDINKLKSFYFVGSTNNENTKKIINTPYGKSIKLKVELFTWEKLDAVKEVKKVFGLK